MGKANCHRIQARAQGLPRFNTGKPCRQGHMSERYTNCGKCVACLAGRSARWNKQNPDKSKAAVSRWEKANPEKAKARADRWRESNPEKVRAATARWRKANPEKDKRWAKENPEKAKARAVRWVKENPEKVREHWRVCRHKRRAQKRGSGGTNTASDRADILRMQKHRCAHPGCGADLRKAGKHLDHIMPLALGGSNDRRNLQYLCPTHNMSKGAKHPIAYAQSQGLLL